MELFFVSFSRYFLRNNNRLASVQEQRLPGTCADLNADEIPRSADSQASNKVQYRFLHFSQFVHKRKKTNSMNPINPTTWNAYV